MQAHGANMKFLLANLLFWLASVGFALKTDTALPLTIEADHATFNRLTGVSIYEGHVVVVQGTSTLLADKIVTQSDKINRLESLVATGNPAYYQTQPSKNAALLKTQAQTLNYHVKDHYLELIGQAHVQQNQDKIDGPHLIYHLIDEVLSSPDDITGRTTIVIQPKP